MELSNKLLKKIFKMLKTGDIIFEYTIPQIRDHIDNILIYNGVNGVIYLIEFKINIPDMQLIKY